MLRSAWRSLLLPALCLALLAAGAPSQAPLTPLDLDRGACGLGLALRRVGSSGRVLYVTAHPDDEHNGVLVRLSRGLGLRTALLTLTRGEGGQNQIGPELFDALGVLRTGELMALHRYDAVEQYFGRAYEFGYSFSVEETLARWGHDDTLGDVVRVMRAFRPDVVLTLPLEGGGGGQHHQAAGRLALEAFRAAADPARFPDQLQAGLRPWQARKIYAGGVGGGTDDLHAPLVRVATGVYDPLVGMTWQQLGSRERTLHRCQGVSQLVADPGPGEGSYALLDSEPKTPGVEADILDGIDTSLSGLARFAPAAAPVASALAALQSRALAARSAFVAGAPERNVPPLVDELLALRSLRGLLGSQVADVTARTELDDRLAVEQCDVEKALARALGLELEARADDGLVTPGQSFQVVASLWDSGRTPVELQELSLDAAPGWRVERRPAESTVGAPQGARSARFVVTVAKGARISQPYWRRLPDRDRNALLVPADETLPWSPPVLIAHARCLIGGAETMLEAPVVFRYEGPFVGGEKRDLVQVVPQLAVRLAPEVLPLPLGAPRPLQLQAFVRSELHGTAEASLRIEAPEGWTVRPASAALRFDYEGEEVAARFELVPPPGLAPGVSLLHAVAVRDGREYRETVQAVAYDHIERRQLVRDADARVIALPVRTAPGVQVGYVMGSGDAVADAIRGLGVAVTMLSPDELRFADLSRFTTIVTGIRAYETRPDLRTAHARLMRWVEAGGHLVVQYNRDAFNRLSPGRAAPRADAESPFTPYPAAVTSERISDETAPMRLLVPGHVLLTAPNRISERDWDGWVQERGIQLLAARDPRYVELLASTDAFPFNPGEKRGLLVDAAVGKGTWTYVGLVLFRQLPAGVPGAFRLLANLVSRGRARAPAPLPGAVSVRRP